MGATILVVDDDPNIRRMVTRALERRGFAVTVFDNAPEALEKLRASSFDMLITDMVMPEMTGLELLESLKTQGIEVPALMMSGAGTIRDAVKAVQFGASDFLEKPFSNDRLLMSVERCLEHVRLKAENEVLRRDAQSGEKTILGESPGVRALRKMIEKVAPSEGRVLITGENGTGKELVASSIHQQSARAEGPFIKLNCSAVPRDLVESELFGHERGAFTGAVKSRPGRFELADGGTLFLDEIGDMPLEMQTKLLRVLQEGQLERVGGTRTIDVDVRVLAATNRDLETMVSDGDFREDLYYRLNVVHIEVPALRERAEDVVRLAQIFLARAAKANRSAVTDFSAEALALLAAYSFPGNIRELQNLVERFVILADGSTIDVDAVRMALGRGKTETRATYQDGQSLNVHLEDFERRVITEAIAKHGKRAAAARALQVERSFFYKKCRKFGIDAD